MTNLEKFDEKINSKPRQALIDLESKIEDEIRELKDKEKRESLDLGSKIRPLMNRKKGSFMR